MRVLLAVLGVLQAMLVFVLALPVLMIVAVIAAIALWRARRGDEKLPRRGDLDVAA